MTTQEKCEAILRKMLELANAGKTVSLVEDWGGNTATVRVGDDHTHVGAPDGEWDLFIDQLYGALCEGRGLSWA